jgi:hypothetical protein
MAVLSRVLEHAVDQVHGGDHRRSAANEVPGPGSE